VPAVSVEALALAEELRALPLTWRKAIVLHHLVGMPVAEAAKTLGVPAGTVKTWLARGRRALAARLGEQQGAVRRD
jgi:DNA-directed RNA polymerase specialized sigma24 family protein